MEWKSAVASAWKSSFAFSTLPLSTFPPSTYLGILLRLRMATAREKGGLLHRRWQVGIDCHFTSATLRRTPSLTADGSWLQLVSADSKMSPNSLPPNLTAWIYLTVLPRWRRQTYRFLALQKIGISQYAGTFLDMRRAIESRTFAWLSITPDVREICD